MFAVRLFEPSGEERIVGVRCSDAEVLARLRDALAAHVVDGVDADPNVSLRVGESRRGRRDAHLVYRRGFRTYQSFDLDDAIGAALDVVHTLRMPEAGLYAVHARALLAGEHAVLVSEGFADAIDGHRRKVTAAGFTVARHSPVLVDLASGEVVLPAGGDPVAPATRRVPVRKVVVFAPMADDVASPVVRLSHFTALVAGRGAPTTHVDLEALVTLQERLPFVRLDRLDARSVLSAAADG